MLEAVIVVVVLVTVAMGARRGWGRLQRQRGLARLDATTITRLEKGVTIRALVQDMPSLGLDPKRANRLVGDLALGADRFVIATNRGVVVDVGAAHGVSIRSARCTGPGRLVIEGDAPRAGAGRGMVRLELVVADAVGWVEALKPFVEGPR